MAVLEKIRVKFGIVIAVLIAVALLSFILDPQTLASASRMLSSDNVVGKMDGKSISYQDFYEEYNNITKVAEILGQNSSSEEAQKQLRDAAWQSIFDQMVFIPRCQASGITVSDAEMFDLTQGSSISPVLLQQPAFAGQDGAFSREAFVNFVQSIEADESGYAAQYYDFLEDNIFRTQLYGKYASLLNASAVQSALQISRSVAENNNTAEVDYVFVTPGFERDSSITVTKADIKKYYDEHKELMKQPANRDIEYVMWEVVPSAEDISEAREEFDALYEEFKTADNLRNFVTLNSDGKFDTYYYKESQIAAIPEFADLVSGAVKEVSQIHIEENSFSAARIADVKNMADSAHVFYKAFPIDQAGSADSLLAVVQKGGADEAEFQELGWLTQEIALANGLSDFLPVFALEGKATVIKSTQNQAAFVVLVKEKTKPVKKFQLATIVKNVLPSDATYRDFQIKATELADVANGSYEKFNKYVSENNLPVVPLNNMTEATRRVGVAENARELVRWVFEKKTKVGSVSDVIAVENKYYFVAAVTGVHKEGVATLAEMAPTIENVIYAQKAVEKKYEEVAAKVGGLTSLEAVAEALGSTVSHATGLAFGSQQPGLEPAVVGAVAVADAGAIKTVKGQIGVYVFKVAESAQGSFFSEEDARTAATRNASYQSSVLQNVIATDAEVKDYRARFF